MKELVPHSPAWEAEFQAESAAIAMALGDTASTIHHIGSTSIAGIYAKAIVDILVEVDAVTSVDSKNSAMGKLGYECMGEYGICGRRYFRRVSAEGVRTHHVHMFNIGSEQTHRGSGLARQYFNIRRKYVDD